MAVRRGGEAERKPLDVTVAPGSTEAHTRRNDSTAAPSRQQAWLRRRSAGGRLRAAPNVAAAVRSPPQVATCVRRLRRWRGYSFCAKRRGLPSQQRPAPAREGPALATSTSQRRRGPRKAANGLDLDFCEARVRSSQLAAHCGSAARLSIDELLNRDPDACIIKMRRTKVVIVCACSAHANTFVPQPERGTSCASPRRLLNISHGQLRHDKGRALGQLVIPNQKRTGNRVVHSDDVRRGGEDVAMDAYVLELIARAVLDHATARARAHVWPVGRRHDAIAHSSPIRRKNPAFGVTAGHLSLE